MSTRCTHSLRGSRRWWAVGAVLAALPAIAAAQETVPASEPGPAASEASRTVDFSADTIDYDATGDIVTARGRVLLEREAWRVRADAVTWNRRTGEVVARGNVALTNPQGDTAYGDHVTLTDSLRDGMIDQLLVVFGEGGRLAAARGERLANGDLRLERATYSPCPVSDADGCPRRPTWLVRAERVTYSAAEERVRYEGARISLLGLATLPLPAFSHPIGGGTSDGFLTPDLRFDDINGVEVAVPYYRRYSDRLDVTATPHIYTNVLPMAEAQVRGLTRRGAFDVRGWLTASRQTSATFASSGNFRLRGAVEAAAGYQFTPQWSADSSIRWASDRTFLRRYDISRDDRLRSTVAVRRLDERSMFSIAGWATQTLRLGDSQGQQPIALPLIDYRRRIDALPVPGSLLLEANTLSLLRTSGQDTQRLFAGGTWNWRGLLPMGVEYSLTGLGRVDVYHTQSTALSPVIDYRGAEGWQTRAILLGAAEASWPLVGAFAGGTQRLTPRVQVVIAAPVNNIDIPNEDSRAFELEDVNIFSLNRFNGHDRVEDGSRATYGVEWNWQRRDLAITTQLAQSFRLDDQPQLFVPGTGLDDQFSDIVGRTSVAWRDFVRLTHRFRLDKDNLAIRRNEIDATVGSDRTYAVVGYSRLNRDILSRGEDLRDREEVRVGGRWQISRHWSAFGSAIVDLTGPEDDPLVVGDGFEPIRHRIGVGYEDECFAFSLTWRRDYLDTGDARAGNSFLVRVAFRNLGV